MNKKLFSWKALAGLALLVAMGLTSCKNNTEVDPNDPYATKTPTTPSASTKGSADVTITVLTGADLAAQWNALPLKTRQDLGDKGTLNVNVNTAGYKLDGLVMNIPNFFAASTQTGGTTGKVVNITFTTSFQNAGYNLTQREYAKTGANQVNAAKKQFLYLNTDAAAGNQVNFFFSAQNIDLKLESTQTQTSLNSEAGTNIGILTAKTATDKSALKINSGIAVKGISLASGNVILNGGTVAAQVADDATATYDYVANNNNWANGGFKVGGIYVKSLIADCDIVAKIGAGLKDGEGTAESIIIKKDGAVNIAVAKPHVNSIVGENANAKLTLNGTNDNSGNYAADLDNIGSLEKVVVTTGILAGKAVKLADASKFNTIEFTDSVVLNTNTISGLTFKKLGIPVSADNVTYTFSEVKFKAVPKLIANYKSVTGSRTKTWQWIVSGTSGYWSEVTSSAPLKAYNASADVLEFSSADVLPTEGSAALGGGASWKVPSTCTVMKINYDSTATIWPEGTLISLDKCKYYDGTTTVDVQGDTANTLFGNISEKTAWYDVMVDGVTYKWRLSSADKWVLIKP